MGGYSMIDLDFYVREAKTIKESVAVGTFIKTGKGNDPATLQGHVGWVRDAGL
jgi:hypothetical protein